MIIDNQYRKSFGTYEEHICIITGLAFTEFSTESVDGAHITIGRYARGKKPSDDLILPLRHSLHLEFDKNQRVFLRNRWHQFPILWIAQARITVDEHLMSEDLPVPKISDIGYKVKIIKQLARDYYIRWRG